MRLDESVLYVDHGDVLTSAGAASGLDACLHLVRARLGSQAANEVARQLVIAPHREGGQAQYVERPMPRHPDDDAIGGGFSPPRRCVRPGPRARRGPGR